MNVLMVTPHLPPHQAANALLPALLGEALRARGHGVRFLTFGAGADQEPVFYVKRRSPRLRVTRLPQALEAADTWRKARPLMETTDVVHIHSNTWMNQVAARLSTRKGKPYVLTHYGTEIWHHDGKDRAFRRLNARASHVTFYSEALLARGRELRVPCRAASVVYPPVADAFRPLAPASREEVRRRYAPEAEVVLLNVKRLHPLADQATLLEAMALLRAGGALPPTTLLIAGSGEAEPALREQARSLGLQASVRFLGLVPNHEVAALQAAADLFVLSSVLEATPTVALEALASGTPVVSTDNPGGVELGAMFGAEVTVVPMRDPAALATAVRAFLAKPRRVGDAAAQLIEARFRLPGVADRYLELYRQAAAS